MFLLALSRGHGSTIMVTSLVANALPPLSEMVSRRSRYSEQPASSTPSAASASAGLMDRGIGNPYRFGQIEHVPGVRLLLGFGEARALGRQLLGLLVGQFGLAQQEEVDVVRRDRVVARDLELVARARGTHDVRRLDDRQIGLVLLVGLRGEQRPQ